MKDTLSCLWQLSRHADAAARHHFAFAIGGAAAAALAEAASLFLVHYAFRSLVSASAQAGSPLGTSAFQTLLVVALAGSSLRYLAQRQMVVAQHAITVSLATRAFSILQNQSYARHLDGGASEAFATFDRLQIACFNALGPLMAGLAALGTSAALLLTILLIYPAIGLGLLIAIALSGLWVLRDRPGPLGAGLSNLSRERARLVFEARTAFRDISLTNGQQRMCDDFAEVERKFREGQAQIAKAAQSSRHGVEIAGLVTILALLLLFPLPGNAAGSAVPVLAVLALAALRLLPQLAAVRSSIQMIGQHGDVARDVLMLFKAPGPDAAPEGPELRFARSLELSGVHVERSGRAATLRGLDFRMEPGSRIGVVGESGAGKSTMLDVLCGLLPPTSGRVLIDGAVLEPGNAAAWRSRIGVVSQNPVILGRTLRQAICYPVEPDAADREQMDLAIRASGLEAMIAGFEHGLDTELGEVMSRLSGGQRQRLALAHALYRARDLLILDEATGQMDALNEAAILESLESLPRSLAILIVTHRPALLACCDRVFELSSGVLRPGPAHDAAENTE